MEGGKKWGKGGRRGFRGFMTPDFGVVTGRLERRQRRPSHPPSLPLPFYHLLERVADGPSHLPPSSWNDLPLWHSLLAAKT